MCDDSLKIWNVKHVEKSPNTKPVKTGKMKQFRETTPSFGFTIPREFRVGAFFRFRILARSCCVLLLVPPGFAAAVAAAAAVTKACCLVWSYLIMNQNADASKFELYLAWDSMFGKAQKRPRKEHKNCSILVDTWHGNTWSAQALDLLGLRDVARRAHVRYSVGIAFIPPAPPMHHTFPAELNATVAQLLAAAGVADDSSWSWRSGSVLFIQRTSSESQHSAIHSECPKGVRMREILNMEEVEAALRSRFGTRLLIFRSHGLHLAQQIKAFRNASMASAMKLQHQSYVVPSSSVEPAGRCSLDCMRLHAVALADVAQAAISHDHR